MCYGIHIRVCSNPFLHIVTCQPRRQQPFSLSTSYEQQSSTGQSSSIKISKYFDVAIAGEAAAALSKCLLSEDVAYSRQLEQAAAGQASAPEWIRKRLRVTAEATQQLSRLTSWTEMYIAAVDPSSGEYLFTPETCRRLLCLISRVARRMYEGADLYHGTVSFKR